MKYQSIKEIFFANATGYTFIRVLDVLMLVVTARLIGVNSFAVLSLAMAIVAAVDTLLMVDVDSACIQGKKDLSCYLGTAWSIKIIRSIVVACLLVLLAPVFAGFFNAAMLNRVLPLLAIYILVQGFRNSGIIVFYREMDILKKFEYLGISKLFDVFFKIIFCLWFRSYWGLVYGIMAGGVADVIVSYRVSRFRPIFKIDGAIALEMIRFTKWITLSGIVGYFIYNTDSFYVAKVLGLSALGLYRAASRIRLFFSDVGYFVLYEIFFPFFSHKGRTDNAYTLAVYKKSVKVIFVASILLSALFFLMMGKIVYYLMGPEWMGAVIIARVFMVSVPALFFANISYGALRAVGFPGTVVFFQFICLAIIAILLYPMGSLFGGVGVACAVVIATTVLSPFIYATTLAKIVAEDPRVLHGS